MSYTSALLSWTTARKTMLSNCEETPNKLTCRSKLSCSNQKSTCCPSSHMRDIFLSKRRWKTNRWTVSKIIFMFISACSQSVLANSWRLYFAPSHSGIIQNVYLISVIILKALAFCESTRLPPIISIFFSEILGVWKCLPQRFSYSCS